MNDSKKAIVLSSFLISAVVAVIIIVILIVILKTISDSSEEAAYNSRCKTSVTAYSKIKNMPFGDYKADEADINCPTKYLTIDSDSKNNMRRDIADLMAQCWSNFGEGKIKLFSADDEKFCVVCSVFEFEDKDEQLNGITSFLMTEKAPVIRENRHPTYQEYLTGVQTDPDVVDQAKQGADINYLDGSKSYAIMFTYYKESYWSKIKGAVAGAAVGVVGSVIAIAITGVSFGIAAPLSVLIVTGSITAGVALAGGETTTEGADWDANIIMAEYNKEGIEALGCDYLPISQIDERFK